MPTAGKKAGHGKCFACGRGADLITLYQQATGASYGEALWQLAAEYAPSLLPYSHQPQRPSSLPMRTNTAAQPPPPFAGIPPEVASRTLGQYHLNGLFPWLAHRLGVIDATRIAHMYHLGRADAGRVVFWGKDAQGRYRYGQVVRFDTDGHTARYVDKKGKHRKAVSWAHSRLLSKHEKQRTPLPPWYAPYKSFVDHYAVNACLFGEHLLAASPAARVGIVESPKTALLCAGMFPQMVWVATLGLGQLNATHCHALAGRHITLYPDLGPAHKGQTPFNQWYTQGADLQATLAGSTVVVDTTLETYAQANPDLRHSKLDFADLFDGLTTAELAELRNIGASKPATSPHAQLLALAQDVLGLELDLLATEPYSPLEIAAAPLPACQP